MQAAVKLFHLDIDDSDDMLTALHDEMRLHIDKHRIYLQGNVGSEYGCLAQP